MPTKTSPHDELPPELLKPRQVANVLNLSPARVQQLLRSGAIPARRLGRRVLIHREDLDAYIQNLPKYTDTIPQVT